jgi:glycosyltransferase involved in cell wall biosynthesis
MAENVAPARASAADAPSRPPLATGWRLLVAMPALNEAATIGEVIRRIPRAIEGMASVDVLVIDDGSTDETVNIARAEGAHVISHGRNLGLGTALQNAIQYALERNVDVLVNIDADGQFAPEDIVKLVQPVVGGHADMATASRFKDPSLVPEMPPLKLWGNHKMSALISTICGDRFYDVSCGFRCYSRETLLKLVLTGRFTYTQETFLVLSLKGLKIVEVPLAVRGVREHGTSRMASNLFRYGTRTAGIIFGCLRDYRPERLFHPVAFGLLMLSFAAGAFFIAHRIVAGQFTPHIWAGFVSAFVFGLALLVFVMGQIAMSVSRIRHVQDEQLYILRKELLGAVRRG